MYDVDFLKVNIKELEQLFENYFEGKLYKIVSDEYKTLMDVKILYDNKEDLKKDINKILDLNNDMTLTNTNYIEQDFYFPLNLSA